MPIIKNNFSFPRMISAAGDKNLKLKDFGLLVKLMTIPNGTKFTLKQLQATSKDMQWSFIHAFHTLEDLGYLKRYQVRIKGQLKWVYEVTAFPDLYVKHVDEDLEI